MEENNVPVVEETDETTTEPESSIPWTPIFAALLAGTAVAGGVAYKVKKSRHKDQASGPVEFVEGTIVSSVPTPPQPSS